MLNSKHENSHKNNIKKLLRHAKNFASTSLCHLEMGLGA
jgi:hypothetical protein